MLGKEYFENNKIAIRFESFEQYKHICETIEQKDYCPDPRMKWDNGWTSFYKEKRESGVVWGGWTSSFESYRLEKYQVITFEEFLFLTAKEPTEELIKSLSI